MVLPSIRWTTFNVTKSPLPCIKDGGLSQLESEELALKTLQKILLGCVLVLFGAAIAFVITYTELTNIYSAVLEQITTSEVAAKCVEVEAVIDHYFVGETDETVLSDAAAAALVEATGDRWSYYISAEDYASHLEQMANEYVGIGITISLDETTEGFTILEVTEGGPAEESGVLAGDVLIGVDETDVCGMDVNAVKTLVRGKEGTTVSLSLLRGTEIVTLDITRKTIEQVVASSRMLDDTVGYVQIVNFDGKCAEQTIAAIEAVLAEGAESLVFDVRNNPGGYQSELVEVLDYLLPEGVLFRMKYYDGEEKVDYSDADCLDIPMAVLINENSYSAAEFFAAALQEYDAAEIVGAQTCGKGYFQNTYPLSDGSAMVLSSGSYYTPNNVSLTDIGVEPDVAVEMSDADNAALYAGDLAEADDTQLLEAWKVLGGTP